MSDDERSVAMRVAAMEPEARKEFLSGYSAEQLEALKWDWRFWARPKQLAPKGDWRRWLVLAGRGFGKSRLGAEWIRSQVCGPTPLARGRCEFVALVGETTKDVRDIMVEGKAGILAVHPPDFRPHYEPSKTRVTWANGAVAYLYNATEPDQLRGPAFEASWCDELCFIFNTLVATPCGEIGIQDISVGDEVLTRAGCRRVTGTRNRKASVGRIRFDNGTELIGTAEHPVLLSHGWTSLSDLAIGDMACAMRVSNGKASGGIPIEGKITNIAEPGRWGEETEPGFIGKFTGPFMVLYRKVSTFITRMATIETMPSAIWNCSLAVSTWPITGKPRRFHGPIGRTCPSRSFCASIAGSRLAAVAEEGKRFARDVNSDELRQNGKRAAHAATAGLGLSADLDTFAVSVVSTWEPVGERTVYNIQVEDQPEYFANGILVHNCKWQYASDTWNMLRFTMRDGSNPKIVITTTPRPISLLRELLKDEHTVVTRGSMQENRANLAESYIEDIEKKYAGTRLGRQEIDAEMLDDMPNALWNRDNLDKYRRKPGDIPAMKRIVVAVDPAAKSNKFREDGAATGIVACGIGTDGRGYVLEDATCRESPDGWARRAVALYDRLEADCIVGEINQGGDMVASVIKSVRPNIPFRTVHATRGKWLRAEPVAALFEQGRMSMVGMFAALEDEMVAFGPDGMADGVSPDHVDSLVHACTELFPQMTKRTSRWPSLIFETARNYDPFGQNYRAGR